MTLIEYLHETVLLFKTKGDARSAAADENKVVCIMFGFRKASNKMRTK